MFTPRPALLCSAFLSLVLATACTSPPKKADIGPPQRIISVVPSVTEALFAFGLGDRVAAVSDFDDFPPEALTKPRIGALLNPDIERIMALQPDLVIAYGSQGVLKEKLQSTGIRMISFVHGNVDHTLRQMLEIGRAVGAEDRANEVVGSLRQTFDRVRSEAPATRPKVFLVHDRRAGTLGSFYSVGGRAFQHDLIEIAGGRNLFEDVDSETIQPTLEEIIRRKPDIILETEAPPLTASEIEQRKKDWERIGFTQVYVEAESFFIVPGPRLALAARRLGEIVREGSRRDNRQSHAR